MVVQFPVTGSKGVKHVFTIVKGKYYQNGKEITKEAYDKALEYFYTTRKK
jgi:hypothetical protein